MLRILPHSCICYPSKLSQLQYSQRNSREFRPTYAKKSNVDENSRTNGLNLFNLRVTKGLLAKSAIVVFGLGFLDAGYSGDWSRIGVISKEIEELLRASAYIVVPLCLLIAFYIADDGKTL